MFKKTLAWLLALCMVLTIVPFSAFATEGTATVTDTNTSNTGSTTETGTEGNNDTVVADLEIGTVEDLLAFAKEVNDGNNFAGKIVRLVDDIDLNGETWTPLASFAGEFDGNKKTIKNFRIDATAGSGGFFKTIEAGSGERVHDLTLSDVTATVGNKRFGTLANSVKGIVNRVTVKNVTVTTTHTGAWVGGMCAFMSWPWMNDCTVENLVVDATAGADLIGGFACILQKNSNMVFDNNDVKGFKVTVVDTDSSGCGVGGFVAQTQRGWENPKIINSDITGIDITASGLVDVGGFIAWPGAHTIAENCTTEGKIDVTGVTSDGCFAGGFFGNLGWNADLGQMGHTVSNCSADVDITTKVVSAGGFVGSATNSNNNAMYATFNNCSASGDITAVEGATADIGGFFGEGDRGAYNNCTATGTVTNNGSGHAGNFGGALYDVTPKYDHRYPAGTREYLVDQIFIVNCSGASELDLIGSIEEGVTYTIKNDAVAYCKGTYYNTLAEAIAAANAVEGGATVTLLADVTLGEKLTISGNVTIKGGYTITRADTYTATLFAVNAGAALTLDGGLVIDGGNNYTFDADLYAQDLADWNTSTPSADNAKWFTPEEGAPVATAYMITASGTVNLKNVTVKNHYSTNGSGIVSASKGAVVTLTGAQITHNASTSGSGLVVNASAGVWSREEELITVVMNEGTVIDGNHVGGNHGIFKIYMGTYFTMNGGEVKNTTGWNSNGTVVGIYFAVFTMNGGTICSNSSEYGPNNGRNAAIYGHSNHLFTMNGGTICHNSGRARAGIDSPYSETGYTGLTVINGGSVVDNTVIGTWTTPDVFGGATLTVNGGTFTQDVSAWLAPDIGLVYDEATDTYGTTKDLYEYNGVAYNSLADVIATIVSTPATMSDDDTTPVVKVLASHKIDDAVVVGTNLVLDLNGKTITGVDVYPVIRVQDGANVTVKNGNITNNDYVFVLGASDGSSAGNLTIESGKYHGNTTVASVTKGTLTVLGGEFSVVPYEESYGYTLNCIDANYKDGSASIVVKGGTFYKFNPENNAAEGTETNFCADGYLAEADGDYYTVRVDKDTLDAVVEITFTDSNSNETVTLKYPSERYDTIQKLIGTNDYADFVFGASQSELLAYIADGRASDIVITLYDDIELDAPINFYNKYYSMAVEYALTVNGNGHTFTWADGYTGTLFNVESGADVTLKNVTIDGENAFTFYNDTTAVEDGQSWYTRFVNVGEEDKAVNANVIVNAGNLTLDGVKIQNVTIASDSDNGKTANTETGGYYLMYNDDLALIKSNGGTVNVNNSFITGNAGMVLNADNTTTKLVDSKINGNMFSGRNGGGFDIAGGSMTITDTEINNNKGMARCATIIGVTTNSTVVMEGNSTINNNKHLGVGSNTAGAMIVVREGSTFTMNGGEIKDNVGGRAGAIASRFATADANVVLNAGTITGNTATKDDWSGATIFLRSPATIGDGMTVDGAIVVNAAPGALEITGGTFNGSLSVANGLTAEITGGTFNYDPTEWLANGYVAEDLGNGTYRVTTAINVAGYDKVTGEKFWIEFNSSNFGILEYVELMDHNNYNWVLTISADIDVTAPIVINKDLTINLNGHTLTGVDVYPVIRVQGGANVTVKNGNITNNDYVFVLGASDGSSAGYLTIEDGEYTGDTSVASVTKGTLTILGGKFAVNNDDATFLLNCIDANYRDGSASIVVKGGTFVGFDPEESTSENPVANFCHKDYVSVDNGDGTYTVVSYVEWVQAELFAGNDVTLDRDIVITDYDLVHAHPWASNENGKYNEAHGNGAIFHIIKPGVVLDLNGHSITWDAHDDYYCNKRQVSLFLVTATGNDGETSDFTVVDSVGTGKVDVCGMASGMYVVLTTAKATIEGGTWTNYPCNTCGASNIFMYPSHGGTLNITGGTFEQKNSEYLLGWKGSTKETDANSVGVDYDSTKLVVTGGNFIGFNPEKTKFFDVANSGQETINAVAEGYYAILVDSNTWSIAEAVAVNVETGKGYGDVTDALNAAAAGETVKMLMDYVETDIVIVNKGVTLDLNGKTLTASYLVAFNGNHVVDNSTDKAGLLKIAKNNISLPEDNAQMPVWTTDGYKFATMKLQHTVTELVDGFKIKYRPSFGTAFNVPYFADGAIDNGIQIVIRLSWYDEENGTNASQDFVFSEELVKSIYANGKAFTLTVNGISDMKNVNASLLVISETGVTSVNENVYTFNAQ